MERILVTGGNGFLGRWVTRELKKQGGVHVFTPSSREADLRDPAACARVVENRDLVIHIAANVGGIGYNERHPGKLFYDNATMGIHLMEAARRAGVEKFVTIGTACSYPKYALPPFREEDLWAGYPDETTGIYGLAKKILLTQSIAYRKEYQFNAIYLILVNIYGPEDNFDPVNGHVVPSLIRRMVDAKEKMDERFTVWGSGGATREFIYVEDAARAVAKAAIEYDAAEPVNIGTGKELSIRDLVYRLKDAIGYSGEIVWDVSRPDGQPRRCLDVRRAKEKFGFTATTSIDHGLAKTVEWYLKEGRFNRSRLETKAPGPIDLGLTPISQSR